MAHSISQEETRRNIISDMVKKRNSIVPVIGEDTIVYHPFRVPLVLLGLSYRALKWVRNAFLDEPSGKAKREEGSKVMGRFMHIGSLLYEACLLATQTYVHRL